MVGATLRVVGSRNKTRSISGPAFLNPEYLKHNIVMLVTRAGSFIVDKTDLITSSPKAI